MKYVNIFISEINISTHISIDYHKVQFADSLPYTGLCTTSEGWWKDRKEIEKCRNQIAV